MDLVVAAICMFFGFCVGLIVGMTIMMGAAEEDWRPDVEWLDEADVGRWWMDWYERNVER